MRLDPVEIIQEIIEATPAITSLLGTTGGFPNVAKDLAPDEMSMPYIVLREEADTMAENNLLGNALVSADVYTEGKNGRRLAREIAGEIEKLFNEKHYGDDGENVGAGAKKSFIRQRYAPPQPDPSIQCRNIKIELHYLRNDLLLD